MKNHKTQAVTRAMLNAVWNERKDLMIKSLDKNYRKKVFDKHKPENESNLPLPNLKSALSECGRQDLPNAMESLSRGCSFDEFENIVLNPSRLDYWASTLSLPEVLAICLSRNDTTDELKEVTELDKDSIKHVVNLFAVQLELVLNRSVKQLQEATRKMSEQQAAFVGNEDKFVGFVGGNVDVFYEPLTARLGWPNPQFEKSMENEHREGRTFIEKRSGVSISPKDEYDYVVRPELDCPQSKPSRIKRQIEDIPESQDAGLRREEVIALVLYTGPMFHAYNQALRNDTTESRSYSTTLFVLASAIVKLTRVQKISCGTRLYRGLGGDVELPEFFEKPDARGRKGITEYGFLSTTKSRKIAVQYSGAGKGMPIPTIFEIEVGSVSRGANIQAFSQYPREEECLWLPGTFLEPIGEPQLVIENDSVVTVYRVRVQSNLKAMTIDEFISAKRDMHLDAFDRLIHDVKQSLEEKSSILESRLNKDISLHHNQEGEPVREPICTVASFVKKVVQQCTHVKELQSQAPLSKFALDTQLLEYALSMLETAKMARSKLLCYLQDNSRRICFDLDSSLKTCHRERMSFLWRSLAPDGSDRVRNARELCVELGLLTAAAVECSDVQQLGRNALSSTLDVELGLFEDGGNDPVDCDASEPRLVAAAADGKSKRDLLLLLAAGANLNGRDKEGATPIFAAARYGHEDCLRLLLDQKADMNLRNKKKESPVYKAVQGGQSDCLDVLIGVKADVLSPDKEGMTPAWVAAQRGRHEMLRALARAGADLDVADSVGDTPVLAAAHAGHTTCVKALIELHANIGQANKNGFTPLMIAAQGGYGACVTLLLAARAEVNTRTTLGWSAMHGAASGGSAECIEKLHEAGADLHASFTKKPETAVTPEKAIDKETPSAAKMTSRTEYDEDGFTPLMIAAGGGHVACVAYLLEARAEMNARTDAGRDAVHCAASVGSADCVKLLHEAGAHLHTICRDKETGVQEMAEDISAREGAAAASKEDTVACEKYDACTALLRKLAGTRAAAEQDTGNGQDEEVRAASRRRLE
jgi:ankyrin repeat protein